MRVHMRAVFSLLVCLFTLGSNPYLLTLATYSDDLAKVILFTNKKQTSNLYKGLAIDLKGALKVGEVRDTEKALGMLCSLSLLLIDFVLKNSTC